MTFSNWKQQAASAIVQHEAPAETTPSTSTDAALAEALRQKFTANEIPVRDQTFVASLLQGFSRYGSFTDRQRPHVERLLAASQTPVESPDKPLAEALRAALPEIPQRDLSFAMSLLNGFERFGSFTERQRPYAEKFAALAAPAAPAAPVWDHPAQQPESPQALLCPNLCATINLDKFSRFTVGMLGLSLKNDGSVIWVKWDGRLAGVIDPVTRAYRATRRYLSERALGLCLDALTSVEKDPLAAARENGILTGRCSCCGRPLTDPVSIGFGIGPVCRERGFGVVL